MKEEFSPVPFKDFIIDPTSLDADPFRQFKIWYEEYQKTKPADPTVMYLATADKAAVPSGRIVLLKSISEGGFVFFTNYESRKGRDLLENPLASLTFNWESQHRQVRVFGKVEKTSLKESDDYFASRPLPSQLGPMFPSREV